MSEEIDPQHFRSVMGQVPTCVTVVTALVEGEPVAMVIGSFVSVSLDPPLAGFFCTTTSHTWAQLRSADVMGVNVLAGDQVDVSNACMRDPAERFDGLEWSVVDGAPKFPGTTAELGLEPLPATAPTATGADDEVLRRLHTVLFDTHINVWDEVCQLN